MISEKPIIELCIFIDGEEREYFISGYNGRFNWGLLEAYENDLREEPQTEITDVISKHPEVTYGTITLLAQLTEIEPETQYGTGYGDVLTFSGYYDIKILEVTKIEIAERPPDEPMITWCEHGNMLVCEECACAIDSTEILNEV